MVGKILLVLVCLSAAVSACGTPSQVEAETIIATLPEAQVSVDIGGNEGVSIEFSSFEDSVPGQPENSNPDNEIVYKIVDTGQGKCYDDLDQIVCPELTEAYYGQDAQYSGYQPAYLDGGDGTLTDKVTGLIWAGSPDLNGDGLVDVNDKVSYQEAVDMAGSFGLGGYDDWRLPSIKELYSLINFNGLDPSGLDGIEASNLVPFIDGLFGFGYGDTSAGERLIDAQFATSTIYTSTTMGGNETMFGVNFADGRIKGYPVGETPGGRGEKLFYVLYVRGNPDYGANDFVDNQDGTISDIATGLTWTQSDSGQALDWESSLAYCADLETGGYGDWRLPDVKELQSIVDYSRSPDAAGSAAIDPLFSTSAITNETGETDYPSYWSSTTHANSRNGAYAAYISFGRSMGYMHGSWMDVHGAGAQRSDPKSGDPGDYPTGHGPQGDAIRIYNYARCVRAGADQVQGEIPDEGELIQSADVEIAQSSSTQGLPSGEGPPQEAVQACSGLNEGGECQFTAPHGSVSGICLPVGAQIACVPENRPGQPASSP